MTIGSDIIAYKFNNKGNKPVPGSDSIIESFSCDPLALKSGHIFINIIAYKSQLYHNWLLESLGKWKVGSNDVKSGEWWRKRVKVAVRWVVREWWQQIAMLTQPTTSAMNLVILSPGCVLCPHQDDHAQWCWRGASPLSKRSENFYVDRFPCVPRLAQMACQPGWVWSGVPTTEIGQRPTLESEIPAGPDDTAIIFRAYFSTSVCLFKLGRFPWHCPLPCLKVSGSEQALDKIACSSIGREGVRVVPQWLSLSAAGPPPTGILGLWPFFGQLARSTNENLDSHTPYEISQWGAAQKLTRAYSRKRTVATFLEFFF